MGSGRARNGKSRDGRSRGGRSRGGRSRGRKTRNRRPRNRKSSNNRKRGRVRAKMESWRRGKDLVNYLLARFVFIFYTL